MEFVTFYADFGLNETVHPNQSLEHQEFLSMMDVMFASAKLFHKDIERTILTDLHTDFCGLNDIHIVRFEMDIRKLMMERAKAQMSYIQQNSFSRPLVILDTDILINSSLLPIFEHDFDVAVTWRTNDDMPINGGFIILNNLRSTVSKKFFENYFNIYQEKYVDNAAWFGDQLALRDAIGMSLHELENNTIVDVDGCRILLLPCDIYNFSPNNQYVEINSNLPEKVVLHFKGERKRLMNHFWKAWVKPRGSYSPWVLFDAWRERRWLQQQATREMQGARTKG